MIEIVAEAYINSLPDRKVHDYIRLHYKRFDSGASCLSPEGNLDDLIVPLHNKIEEIRDE